MTNIVSKETFNLHFPSQMGKNHLVEKQGYKYKIYFWHQEFFPIGLPCPTRTVAVKLFDAETFSDGTALSEWAANRVASQPGHPALVQVLGTFEAGGTKGTKGSGGEMIFFGGGFVFFVVSPKQGTTPND